jgi:glycine/D-amino acid oxidase-like deaminating enzyme
VKPTVAPGSGLPWWLEEAPPDPSAPVLERDVEADVAIVGAGYTGLWTTLELRGRDPSLRVVLVEADRSGLGPSGRNGGFLHGYWANLARLRERLGDESALATARAAEGAVAAVRGLGEDVWLCEAGMLKVSVAPAQDVVIERAVAAAQELGVPEEAVALSAEEVAERCR